jgi:subtilase family serine protease
MGKNGWVICSVLSAVSVLPARAQISREPLVNLPGHVLGILSQATLVPRPVQTEQETLTVSVMLKLTDPESFAAFERELNDPNSASYHSDFTTRFGPSQDAYAGVLAYFEQNGFTLVKGSTNRITLTFRATRAQAESAFHVSIDDYLLGDRKFYAIASDPWLPASITSLVAGYPASPTWPDGRRLPHLRRLPPNPS